MGSVVGPSDGLDEGLDVDVLTGASVRPLIVTPKGKVGALVTGGPPPFLSVGKEEETKLGEVVGPLVVPSIG